jgi:hypothetical protein
MPLGVWVGLPMLRRGLRESPAGQPTGRLGDRCYRFFAVFFVFLFAAFFLAGRGGAERSTLGLSAHHIGLTKDGSENADDDCPGCMNIESSPSVCVRRY